MDEWVEQETRHGIRYEKDDVEYDASGDEEEGKEKRERKRSTRESEGGSWLPG